MDYETYIWFAFWSFIFFAAVSFYQSWMNIVHKKLTKISLDALLLIYMRVLHGKKSVEKAKRLLKEPKRIRLLGIIGFCLGLGWIYEAIDWYLLYLR